MTHAKKLRREHQSIAGLLWEAEQQDLIDVFLVRVTHHQWLVNALHNWDEEFEVADSETYVDDWRSLSGKKPGWTDEYTSHRDTILQVKSLEGTCSTSHLACSAPLPEHLRQDTWVLFTPLLPPGLVNTNMSR